MPVLKYAILELLAHQPLTGYEINKRFGSSIVFFWHARPSQVYAELRRLEADSWIEQVEHTPKNRRRRNLFRITEIGADALREWVGSPTSMPQTKDEMQLKAFAFDVIPPERAAALLEQHGRLHADRLAAYERDRERLTKRYGDPETTDDPFALFRLLSIEYGIAYETTYVRWCQNSARRVREGLNRSRAGSERLTAPAGT